MDVFILVMVGVSLALIVSCLIAHGRSIADLRDGDTAGGVKMKGSAFLSWTEWLVDRDSALDRRVDALAQRVEKLESIPVPFSDKPRKRGAKA